MEYIIEVNVSGKWYLLCPLATKDEAQAQAQGAGAEGAEGETGPDGEYYGAGFEDRS